MRNYIIDSNIIDVIKALNDDSKSAVFLNNQIGELFRTRVGERQGCLLSPVLFNIYLENIMTEALSGFQPSISINGPPVCSLRFADDIDLTAGTKKELHDLTTRLETRSKAFGMEVSDEKSKTFLNSTSNSAEVNIKMFNISINTKMAKHFKRWTASNILGLSLQRMAAQQEIRTRLSLASSAMTKLDTIWKSNAISLPVKIRLYKSWVISILLYGC
ncbi:hypothetical protein ACOMHN_056713 [Nucella lapillus]